MMNNILSLVEELAALDEARYSTHSKEKRSWNNPDDAISRGARKQESKISRSFPPRKSPYAYNDFMEVNLE
ncbi:MULTISPECIES: hypothetical protein [Klebsiella]|uniref:hypothetical protein n=1 Tax=Klebsiella TaxID=570 RepID=UPI0015FBBABE|nr:hypothetical protein [Klebsiella michiganensis]